MLCYVFPQWKEDFRVENTRILQPTAPLHRVFDCKTHVLPPPNSRDALQKKTFQPRRCLMAGKMSRKLMMRAFLHRENWTTRCQEMLLETCSRYRYLPSKKDTSYNSIFDIVGDLSMDFVTDCHIYGLEGHELQVRLVFNRLLIQIGLCNGFVCWNGTSHDLILVGRIFHLHERHSALVYICRLFTCQGM